LLRIMLSVRSSSNGRKTRLLCEPGAGTMQRYASDGSIRTLPLRRWIR